jgi:GPH family glycoside/pentoside/hexuronide:cation symporter
MNDLGNNDSVENEVYENSKAIMASYNMNQFFGQWISGPFGMYVFIFYETQIGLSVGLIALAFILYSVWNAINDPLVGYIMIRIRMPWDQRWGKRFPWVIIAGIPWTFTYLFVFLVPFNLDPVADQWTIFTWLLITICVYDTLYTIWGVNVTSMYPDKFRGHNERRTASGIGTLIGMTGIVVSSVIPPLFIDFGVPETFRTQAWIMGAVALIILVFMIPGILEDEKTRNRYQERLLKIKEEKQESFFKTAKKVTSNKRFMTKMLFFFGYQAAVGLLSSSALYMIVFVLDLEAWYLGVLMGAMLLGAFLSVPFWVKLSKKLNDNKKTSIYAGFVMFFAFLPMLIVAELLFFIIVMIFFGIGLGGQWFVDPPTMADVLDDAAIRTGRKEEEIYYGYQAFFIRLSGVAGAIFFAIVHTLTGFVEGSSTRAELLARSPTPELAMLGIRIHTALIPAILVLICTLIFWKFYDLTPDKVAVNKAKLQKLGL